jgi:hypothetical protein
LQRIASKDLPKEPAITARDLAGFGGKNSKKIYSKLFDEGYIEKIALSWIESDKPRVTQKEFLDKFVKEQSQYPIWNVAKKLPEKPEAVQKVGKPRLRKSVAPPISDL